MGFRVPGENEYTGKGFGTLAEDWYVCQVTGFQKKEGAEVTNQYNPNGELRIWFTLAPVAIDGDPEAELLGLDGEPVSEEKTLIFFFDPKRLGLKPQVSKNRAFFAAAMGIPVEQPVEFDSLDALCNALVGKEVVAEVGVKTKGNGEKINVIRSTRPLRKRQPRQRAEKAPLVEAAVNILDAEPVGEAEY